MSFEDYIKDIDPHKLDLKLDEMNKGVDTHLTNIAEKLMDLDNLTTKLGLRHQVYTDIVAQFPRSIPSQRSALIREWKKTKGREATYRVLLAALCEARETDSAEDLVKSLKGVRLSSPSPPPPDQPKTKEEPQYSLEEGRALHRKSKPLPPQKGSKKEALDQFSQEVEFILQTVNDNEHYAATTFMKPPFEEYDRAVTYPSIGSSVGLFADQKTALIQTDIGSSAGKYIQDAFKHFPNAKFLIGIGVGYAFDKKYKLGDVLVSKKISNLANFKVDSDGKIINRGEIIKVDNALVRLFCNDLDFGDFVVAKPTGRTAKVYAGTFASQAILMNNQEMRDKIEAVVPEVIGGEMEGGELLRFKEEKSNVGVIVIKGVVDYGDGEKEKGWQFTAAMAALKYAEAKIAYY